MDELVMRLRENSESCDLSDSIKESIKCGAWEDSYSTLIQSPVDSIPRLKSLKKKHKKLLEKRASVDISRKQLPEKRLFSTVVCKIDEHERLALPPVNETRFSKKEQTESVKNLYQRYRNLKIKYRKSLYEKNKHRSLDNSESLPKLAHIDLRFKMHYKKKNSKQFL